MGEREKDGEHRGEGRREGEGGRVEQREREWGNENL